MEKGNEFCVVYCNTDTFQNAQQIAKILVSEHLAACVSILPNIISYFGWDNVLQERHEFTLMCKTKKDKLDLLENRILELHSDDVPEIISVDVTFAHQPYLDWVNQSLK